MDDMALGWFLSQTLSRNEPIAAPAMRPTNSHPPVSLSKNLNRLLSAAVVNRRFRCLLLSNPVSALAAGYNGESFQLAPAEYAAVTSLRVNTISEFAAQLLRILQNATEDAELHATAVQSDFQLVEEVATQSLRSR